MEQQHLPLHPQLYSTSHRSNSESSEGEREDYYYYNPETVRPGNPAPDLRYFVRTPKTLTREGRERLHSLRPKVGGPYDKKRTARLAENPETPQQSVETPPRSQTETRTHRSREKRKPFSIPKLFGWVPSPDSQYKITTPRDIPSPEFINQTYDLDKRDLESLKLNQEQKPRSPFTHFMDNNGVMWDQANMSSVNPNDNSTNLADTIPLTDNLRQQILNYPPPPNTNEVPINNRAPEGETGFSPPLQEQDMITDQTQYRMPANVPIIEDMGPDLTLPLNRELGARPRPGNPLYVPTTPPSNGRNVERIRKSTIRAYNPSSKCRDVECVRNARYVSNPSNSRYIRNVECVRNARNVSDPTDSRCIKCECEYNNSYGKSNFITGIANAIRKTKYNDTTDSSTTHSDSSAETKFKSTID